ncbi:6-carboxytetrahydropterin synthase [Ferrimonas senticii]|uniref:6-carboxytetrahydropterin synthase n=1 Tax=Ferrimonas senticii TaxID=394566 RepID=UPI000401B10A|nr:6-carboxytetrahydropterin synthase [Ferrimonas senticii]
MKMFVNDLTVIDSSILDTQRGIIGESWIVDLVLEGDLNQQSMVLDFGQVKKQIKHLIDVLVDHRLVIPSLHSSIIHGEENQGVWVRNMHSADSMCHVHGPKEAFCFIACEEVTPQSVANYLEQKILPELPNNIVGLNLALRSEAIDEPFYQYSHGLKKHDGNCQRIAHGHRSRIRIFKDGKLDRDLQTTWASRWNDIYLITEEDVVNKESLSVAAQEVCNAATICTSYTSPQGLFELVLPRKRAEIMPTDTTVECIAEYVANLLAIDNPSSHIEVHAFEGVGKGAMASVSPNRGTE